MSQTSSMPSYTELSNALQDAGAAFPASQVHGYICGILCATSGKLDSSWGNIILGKKKNRAARDMLHQLLETSYHLMSEFSFEFALLLPSDKVDINIRTEALGSWCQGFLTGLQQYQVPIQNREPGEVTDGLNDILEIANVNYGDINEDDEDETAYFELEEYVRLAVLMIFQELNTASPNKKSAEENDWLH